MNVLFYHRFNLIWSTLHSVREILLTLLARLDVESDEIDNTGLVVTEYLTNLIRHSEGEDEAVTLVIGRTLNNITIELVDPTSYFHPTLSQQNNTDLSDGELREGGMGLALIAHYFPDFKYFSNAGKNHFSFTLALKKIKNRIVIIDDDNASLQLINAYLTSDYECHAFDDEHQAYQYLIGHNVDLLVIDMNLNVMLADEFLSNIKQLEHLNSIGIIVISGDGSRETMLKAHLCGVDDYLVKPVSKQQLELVCERVKSRCDTRTLQRKVSAQETQIATYACDELLLSAYGNIASGGGGDVILYHAMEKNTFVFFADVMGHGEKAQRVALELRGFVKGLLTLPYDDFTAFVNTLARTLVKQAFMQQTLVTFIALEITQREISFINAGHPIPLCMSSQQDAIQVGTVQPLLGLSSDYQYHKEHIIIGEGDSLVMATDGLFENHENCNALTELIKVINASKTTLNCDSSALWSKCLPRLSKEIDDSSLLVLN